jgi:hypothetical protein
MSLTDTPPSHASVEARVTLLPKASQTFLVSVTVLAGLCVVCGSGLLSLGANAGWAVCSFAIPLMGTAFLAWRSSQSDTDLDTSAPTTLSSPDGMQISTDSRNLRNVDAVNGLVQLLEASRRTSLPEPDALFENGMVIPNSVVEAQARVQHINNNVEAQSRNIDALLNGPPQEPTILQRPSETMIPSDDSIMNNSPLQTS